MHPPIEESIAQSPRPRITEYFSQGFNIVFKKPLLFVLAIIMMIGFSLILGIIPYVGNLVQNFVVQPLLVLGLYIVADRINYLEDADFQHIFQGFRENLAQVVIISLLIFLIMLLPLALIIYGYYQMLGAENMGALLAGNSNALNLGAMDASGTNLMMILGGALLLLVVALLYLFAIPMLRFKSLGPWQAMEASRKLVSKHLGHFILFLLFAILINLAGALLLVVGLLITIPATYAAIYVAFDDLVSARPKLEGEEEVFQHLIS